MDSQFKPGAIVRLKSGGPTMTVISSGYSPQAKREIVYVIWHDRNDQVQAYQFHSDTLIKAEHS
jgi:uncharacterized protein YodC (DUF2158 family)